MRYQALDGADEAVCLFGACHPDMDDLVAAHKGCRLPGKDCIDAFLPEKERRELEGRKAFVMSPGWLRLRREIFQGGQGWDEVDARQNFGFYESIVLQDFGLEPIDDMEILAFFEYTQTPIEVLPASLDRSRSLIRGVAKVEGESAL